MWRVLKNIYQKVESAIRLGDTVTAFFLIEVGLRQGCILSPLLFLLFINDLGTVVNNLNKGVTFGNGKISILFFADDIVLFAESKSDLELMLRVVYEYSLKWRCKFNYDKCGVIVFDNRNPNRKEIVYGKCSKKCRCGKHYLFGDTLINEVLMYKYLGVDLDYKLSFQSFKSRILSRARSNMGRIWAMGIRSGFLSVEASINLWEALVRSGLEYASEVWGFEIWPEGQKVQLEMGRRILRCQSKTSNEAVLGDLGWISLQARRNLKKLIYWRKIISLPETSLVKKTYLYSKESKKQRSWANGVKKLLSQYNVDTLWNNTENLDGRGNGESKSTGDHLRFWKIFITRKVVAVEESQWRLNMEKKSKLRTYRLFKSKLCFEKYLLSDNYIGRMIQCSLRNGSNRLEVEKGRWSKLEVEMRICKRCEMKKVEDESHFILECNKYKDLRSKLLNGTLDQHQEKVFELFQIFLCQAMKMSGE